MPQKDFATLSLEKQTSHRSTSDNEWSDDRCFISANFAYGNSLRLVAPRFVDGAGPSCDQRASARD
jgi:hypothetical protein